MKLKTSMTTVALVSFVGSGIAQANWLDDAWSDDSVRMHGNPAITIRGDFIHVVLPSATLQQAYDEGIATEELLRDFLERYGQRCSDLIDLNVPHPHLKVKLSLRRQAPFDEIPENDEVLTRLRTAYLKQHIAHSIPLLLTVSPVHFDFTINYVPTRQVRCVAPEVGLPTS